MPAGPRKFLQLLALAAIYFAGAKLGLSFAFVHPNASPVWPPTGIAVAAVLLAGYSVWPAIFLGAFLSNAMTAVTLPTAFFIAAGNTLEALSVGFLLQRFSRSDRILDDTIAFFQFAAFGALSCMISAVIGISSLALAGSAPWSLYGHILATWWLGDFIGLLVVAPLILAWRRPPLSVKLHRLPEALLLGLTLVLTSQIVFGGLEPFRPYPLAFIFFPFFIWAVFRFGARGATASLLIVAAAGVWGTLQGFGAFAQATNNESLLLLQCFVGVAATTALPLNAVISERRREAEALTRSEARYTELAKMLEDRVADRTQSLRDREHELRLLIDGVRDYAIIMLDPRGTVVSWNAGAERIKGYRGEEIIGKHMSCFYPAEDIDAGKPQRLLQIASQMGRTEDEGWRIRKDGSRFMADVVITPVRTERGELWGFSKVTRDITERKHAEEAAREAELQFHSVIESAKDGIILADIQGSIIFWNKGAEAIFGYSEEEVLHHPLTMLMPERFRERHEMGLARMRNTGASRLIGQTIALEGKRKDGTEFPLELSLASWRKGDQTIVSGIVRDITERQRTQEALQRRTQELSRTNAELEQFAYVASHDLQEPLRMVMSYMGLLERRYRDKLDEKAQQYIAFAVDGAERMKTLITDLLAYARTGSSAENFAYVDCSSLVTECLNNLKVAIRESRATVTVDSLPKVMGNASQLMQLFQNLIGNAIKYRSSEPPRIHIGVESRENEFVFSVADNGIGIDPEYFDRIFLIFQRLHGKGEYSGSGIGLAICKKIVANHGGRLSVTSAPERGSTFYFTIPEKETVR